MTLLDAMVKLEEAVTPETWEKGMHFNGKTCLGHHVIRVAANQTPYWNMASMMLKLLAKGIPEGHRAKRDWCDPGTQIVCYNDDPATIFEDIALLIKQARVLAEADSDSE